MCHTICVTPQSTLKNPAFSSIVHLCLFYASQNSDYFPVQYKNLVFRRFSQNCKKRLLASSCLSVHPSAWKHWSPTRRIFMKINIYEYFPKICRENSSYIKTWQHNGHVSWLPIYIFFIIHRSVLIGMRNISEKKRFRENQNIHVMFDAFSSKIMPFME